MAIRIGRWDCTTCGFKGVKGPESECTNCGADRPKNVKFYLADDSEIVQDPELLKKAKAGPDWRCSFCSENNPADLAICNSCGNPRGEDDKKLEVKEYNLANTPTTGDGTKEKKIYSDTPIQEVEKPKAEVVDYSRLGRIKAFGKRHKKKILIGLGIFTFLIILLLLDKNITVKVVSFDWERTIKVEEYKLVEEEGWSVPSGGTETSSFEAIHHYDQVLDRYETRTKTEQRAVGSEQYACGTRDLGNGYFEDKYCTRTIYESYEVSYEEPIYRKEPVYATKYRYLIYRWKSIAPLKSSGKDKEPHWPNTNHIKLNPTHFREGKRKDIYRVQVLDEENILQNDKVPEKIWNKLSVGDRLAAKRGLVFGDYRGINLSNL